MGTSDLSSMGAAMLVHFFPLNGWSVICLPHIPALFIASLKQTDGTKS